MCGIYCVLSRKSPVQVPLQARALLQHRGPDDTGEMTVVAAASKHESVTIHLTCLSSVLSLRGDALTPQPLHSATSGSLLCWNGEAWEIEAAAVGGNDGQLVFAGLNEATAAGLSDLQARQNVLRLLESIRGPHAFVYLDATRHRLYFARDCLGRRSLLKAVTSEGDLILSSVSHPAPDLAWAEVEADGLYMIDVLAHTRLGKSDARAWNFEHIPFAFAGSTETTEDRLVQTLPFAPINQILPEHCSVDSKQRAQAVQTLQTLLEQSLRLRVTNIPDPLASPATAHIAILFSGGLDCTLLVRLAHMITPINEPMDLINVAFENPRIHKDPSVSAYELCPDRITARTSLAELWRTCPGRILKLICVNIPFTETTEHRQQIVDLIHPHNTEMDFSIGCALYFASRGVGIDSVTGSPCSSNARVLLSGLGADELFGGYQRHAIAFARSGPRGLIEELELDFSRLGKRNLGRDDRVLSHWGREARYPYLDEKLVAWALQTPVWVKTGFGSEDDIENGLEPGKLILRQMAWGLGLYGAAREKKRAIQFGSRTAKMHSGRTKGTQLLPGPAT